MIRLLCWLALFFFCVGCCSFNREWERVARQPRWTNEFAGRWTGEWRSEQSGHHGTLKCIITPHSSEAYMARFHATFWKIFSATYLVPLSATNVNGEYQFSGSANLGGFGGGTYTYEGSATAAHFHSTYRSESDHGIFEMTRPPSKEPMP
jgi:hypothetical protein